MNIIKVEKISKIYEISKKEEGIKGSLKSLVRPTKEKIIAVNDVSFSIEAGKTVGLIGSNGAGKTTLLKMMSGLIYPSEGNIEIMNMSPWKRSKEFKKNLSFILGQKQQLWWDLPAIESFNLNKEIYQLNENEYRLFVNEMVDVLNVGHVLSTPVRNLSLGERMKMEIIAGLLHRPKLIFLDEPTIGLDTISQKNIMEFLKEYNRKYGCTILLTSHYMRDIERLCEDVIVINKGEILYDGKLSELKKKGSQNKILTVTFESKVDEEVIKKFGGLFQDNGYSAIFKVNRSNMVQFMEMVLSAFHIEDINIADEPFEEIIEKLLKNE